MTFGEMIEQIKVCIGNMNTRYGGVVFDEWAVVSLAENKARVLFYIGPRNDAFLANFVKDIALLRSELLNGNYGVGDFEFSRHGVGTGFESFVVLGQGHHLICNNTTESMDGITKNPRWLGAQIPFVELAEKVCANPLNVSSETQFFRKAQ